MLIPPRVLQLWGFKTAAAGTAAAEPLPDTPATRSWRPRGAGTGTPAYEHRVLGPDETRQLLVQSYPQWLAAYDGYSEWVERADFGRLVWVYHLGGWYADMDCECLLPLSRWQDAYPRLATATAVFSPDLKPAMTANWCFGAVARSPLLRHILDDLAAHARRDSAAAFSTMLAVLRNTGPLALTRALTSAPLALKTGCLRFEDHVFGAMTPPEGYTRLVEHHFTSSWMPIRARTLFRLLHVAAFVGAALAVVLLAWLLRRWLPAGALQ